MQANMISGTQSLAKLHGVDANQVYGDAVEKYQLMDDDQIKASLANAAQAIYMVHERMDLRDMAGRASKDPSAKAYVQGAIVDAIYTTALVEDAWARKRQVSPLTIENLDRSAILGPQKEKFGRYSGLDTRKDVLFTSLSDAMELWGMGSALSRANDLPSEPMVVRMCGKSFTISSQEPPYCGRGMKEPGDIKNYDGGFSKKEVEQMKQRVNRMKIDGAPLKPV